MSKVEIKLSPFLLSSLSLIFIPLFIFRFFLEEVGASCSFCFLTNTLYTPHSLSVYSFIPAISVPQLNSLILLFTHPVTCMYFFLQLPYEQPCTYTPTLPLFCITVRASHLKEHQYRGHPLSLTQLTH